MRTQNREHPAVPRTEHRASSSQHPVPYQSPSFKLSHHKPCIKRPKVHVHSCGIHEVNLPDAQPPRRSVQQLSHPRARLQAPSVHCPRLQHHQHLRRLHFPTNHTCQIPQLRRQHPKFSHCSHKYNPFPCRSPRAPLDGQEKETTSFLQDNSCEKSIIKSMSATSQPRSGKSNV